MIATKVILAIGALLASQVVAVAAFYDDTPEHHTLSYRTLEDSFIRDMKRRDVEDLLNLLARRDLGLDGSYKLLARNPLRSHLYSTAMEQSEFKNNPFAGYSAPEPSTTASGDTSSQRRRARRQRLYGGRL